MGDPDGVVLTENDFGRKIRHFSGVLSWIDGMVKEKVGFGMIYRERQNDSVILCRLGQHQDMSICRDEIRYHCSAKDQRRVQVLNS